MRAWALNLDAEHELELGARWTPTDALAARSRAIAAAIAETLPPGDRVASPLDQPVSHCTVARAWCPTPRALAALARAGLALEGAPSFEILRTVNERGFAHRLAADELPATVRATSLDAIEAHLARPSPSGAYLLKRAFGVAGRGQRPISGPISAEDRRWIAASLRRGAVYVEPRVAIVRELSVHAWAGPEIQVRSIREQVVRDRAWVRSELARGLAPALERALIDTGERVGRALAACGYHGPFGVDAFEWRTPGGTVALRALSEINARYCMGWDARDGWDPPG